MRIAIAPLLIAAVLGGAAGAAGVTWSMRQAHPRNENLHDLVHQRFDLSPAEHRRLDAAEAGYTARRAAIETRMHDANNRLATAIRANPDLTEDVIRASREVETAASELQRVTLEHIFEMRRALEPEHRAEYDQVLVTALTRDGSGR